MKAVAIVSGGLDSVTLAHFLAREGYALHLLTFHYGQRHAKEIDFARRCAARLGARHDVIDLSSLTHLLKGSALTDDVAVPEGHYADPTMRLTVVPNRNAMMLSIAVAVAVAEGANVVGIGVHTGDHPIYPDCRGVFIEAMDRAMVLATEGFHSPNFRLLAPFVEKTKADIVRLGAALGVPFHATWSCYKGEERHCGRCGTCVERKEAFAVAKVVDPTDYADASGAFREEAACASA